MFKKTKNLAAFTMIELILYIAISSMMFVVMLLFVIEIIDAGADAKFQREVIANARFVLDLISRETHDAQGVSTGTFGSHPGSLTLTADSGTVVINTDVKVVGSQTIRYVQVDHGSGAIQITSDNVNVTNFVFNNLTRNIEPENVQIEITIESLTAETSASLRTAISLRE